MSPIARSLPPVVLALFIVLASPTRGQGVRIVGAPGAGTFADIQSAVAVAVDGDVLLVQQGTYGPVTIDDVALTVVALGGASVQIDGTVTVKNLAPGRDVVLTGLRSTGHTAGFFGDAGLLLEKNSGSVVLRECVFTGGVGGMGYYPGGSGGPGALVRACPRVAFVGCGLVGGEGFSPPYQVYDSTGGLGGPGLIAQGARVAVYGGLLRGGDAGDGGAYGGDGGRGASLTRAEVYFTATTLQGGRGGDGLDFIFACAGDGGDGLVVNAQSHAVLEGATVTGGAPGTTVIAPACTPNAGQPITGAGKARAVPGTARSLSAVRLASDASLLSLTVRGEPGELVLIATATTPGFVPIGTSVWLLPPAALPVGPAVGSIPASGSLTLQVPVPDFPATPVARTFHVQAVLIDASNERHLARPVQVALLERGAPPDCNANGVSDYLDVAEATSLDCQRNFVPDECDIAVGSSGDCNQNGVPDECDIAAGTSMDLDGNGVPDECEVTPMTWYVDAAAAAGGNGSQATPFGTVQQGVDAASHYDTVEVAAGLYTGLGNRDVLVEGLQLVIRSAGGAGTCVIDCQGAGRGFEIRGPGPGRTTIQGFTIRDGQAYQGAGIYALGAKVSLLDCFISGCQAGGSGGGVYLGSGIDCEVRGSRFEGNSAGSSGGGVSLNQTVPKIVGCLFVDNYAGSRGGGLYNSSPQTNGTLLVSHCRFLSNATAFDGGGMWIGQTAQHRTAIDDCLVAGNAAATGGGAAILDGSIVTGSTFVGNTASQQGGALHVYYNGPHRLENSVLWDNAAPSGAQIHLQGAPSAVLTVRYSDVLGGQAGVAKTFAPILTWGAGNLDLDPLFVDADGPDNDPLTQLDNDYRLGPGSPCVDAGDNAAVPADRGDVDGDMDLAEPVPLDLLGSARFVDDPAVPDSGAGTAPIVDAGCYERRP